MPVDYITRRVTAASIAIRFIESQTRMTTVIHGLAVTDVLVGPIRNVRKRQVFNVNLVLLTCVQNAEPCRTMIKQALVLIRQRIMEI
jgi:hypothetical protein